MLKKTVVGVVASTLMFVGFSYQASAYDKVINAYNTKGGHDQDSDYFKKGKIDVFYKNKGGHGKMRHEFTRQINRWPDDLIWAKNSKSKSKGGAKRTATHNSYYYVEVDGGNGYTKAYR
ncbi:hypothetical protein SAMN05444487_11076 [Marininema mesophilum]|uniref:Bacteriocin (Lactococcin_972) n=1 Tax=Marininema mesophilum TaxID=1048340 RepID=A0A1H2Z1X4_9BACL|nr:hypothetical protein [Marininema mesophilum]SDX10914.1 hypothetical protein SAMN05444487_11076 [Marininema mesophilum]